METTIISPAALEAVRTLALEGVSDGVLGSVVREILSHSDKPVPPRHTLLAETGPAITETPASQKTSFPAATSPARNDQALVPIKVRFPSGHATNVTVKQALLLQAEKLKGDSPEARKWVRELALSAPSDVSNLSAWVRDQIALAISAAERAE